VIFLKLRHDPANGQNHPLACLGIGPDRTGALFSAMPSTDLPAST